MLTLWGHVGQWLEPIVRAFAPPRQRPKPRRPRPPHPTLFPPVPPTSDPAEVGAPSSPPSSAPPLPEPAQARYDRVTRAMLAEHGIRVRKWRTSMSGLAWEVYYRDGRVQRLIEAPRPKGPMSAAVFLHEIGHHAIGFKTYKPRCLEEYHAWRWSLEAMERAGLNITDAVRHRMHLSLWYAVAKARRRGLRELPPELLPFVDRPPRRRSTPRGRRS